MQWSVTTEIEAKAMMPENNMRDGRYKGVVTRQEVIKGKSKEDGSVGDDWLKLNILFDTPFGKIYGEAAIFNGGGKMFYKRKHFWESAGYPERINSPPEHYLDQHIEADCKVESYFSTKYQENKKKYVVIDFVGDSAKEKTNDSFIEDEIKF